jgi:MFS transporter, SHS family, lactate transporter
MANESQIAPVAPVVAPAGPWYAQVNATQWRAFWATFLGWVLDGFDFTILTFILIDIQGTFGLDRAQTGALGTITLLMRFVGGAAAGTAADRWGRRLPLMISILWFSLFAGLSGFATSYSMLFIFRALFGIGMGGEWAAGMPLVIEHWPAHLRGTASGLLQGGYSWGFIISALIFNYLYPYLTQYGELSWRAMFWVGIAPALLVLWIRKNVEESPVWLERQKHLQDTKKSDGVSLLRIFRADLLPTTIQTSILLGSFMFSYYSISFWYATYLREMGRRTLWYLVALNLGGIIGAAAWGRISEMRPGRRGSATIAAVFSLGAVPFYLYSTTSGMMLFGAVLMGFFGAGMWGMVPTYLSERFPTAVRGVGSGFAYHAGAAIGALTPFVVGFLQDTGWTLGNTMAVCITTSLLIVIAVLWMGPETRGKELLAVDGT